MRNFYILIFIFISFNNNSFSQKVKPDINKIFKPSNKCNFPVTKEEYNFHSGFCSTYLTLFSDSTFTKDFGCEAEGNVATGNWFIEKDSIVLIETDKDSLEVICDIKFSRCSKSKNKTIIFKDKSNLPINNIYLIPPKFISNFLIENKGIITYGKFSNSEFEKWTHISDSSGTIQFNIKKYDSLELLDSYQLTGKKLKFTTKNLPDTIEIKFSVSAGFFSNPINYYSIIKVFKLKKEDNKLISKYYTMTRLEEN